MRDEIFKCLTLFGTAWVLWSHTKAQDDNFWEVISAYETRNECSIQIETIIDKKRAEISKKNKKDPVIFSPDGWVSKRDDKTMTAVQLTCLPDTIDPRERKEK